MKVCVLIPIHNEAGTIGSLVEGIRNKGFDMVVVDDGSTDNGGDIALQKGAFVIRHEQKKGKGKSLQDGFQHILTFSYDGVVTMDGDGQHAIEDLDRFLKCAQQHPQSVITGNRMQNPKGMPGIRYLTNQFMSGLISSVCRQHIPDTQCGYRYIGTGILRELPLKCSDFEIETEILIKACKRRHPVYSVPIRTIYQNEQSKIRPIKDTLRFITYFLKEIFSREQNG